MTQIAFNALTSAPQGVFTPMLRTEKLDVKLAASGPGTRHAFEHRNVHSSETYVVMQGDYSIRVGPQAAEKRLEAKAGDVFTIPKGLPHGDSQTRDGYRILLMETPTRNPVLTYLFTWLGSARLYPLR